MSGANQQSDKKRKCSGCKEYRVPIGSTPRARWCSDECLNLILAKQIGSIEKKREAERRKAVKVERQKHTANKKRLRGSDNSIQLQNTQQAFNGMIRALDAGLPCISCGRFECGHRMTCGHYKTVGSTPELRFDPRNAYLQGSACNQGEAKYGGARARTVGQNYTEALGERMGLEMVEFLNGPHSLVKFDVLWLASVRRLFLNERAILEAGGVPTRDWRDLRGHKDLQPPLLIATA